MKSPLIEQELAQFTGSERWYRHAINQKVRFTEGAKYVADRADAYWLLDEIALIQPYDKRVSAETFQIWKLEVNAKHYGQLVCEDGNGKVIYSKTIPFADFPGDGITLWFTHNTILLPTEY